MTDVTFSSFDDTVSVELLTSEEESSDESEVVEVEFDDESLSTSIS